MTTLNEKGLAWPERLTLRDTTIYADEGQRIFTTATGHGYEKQDYVRADLVPAVRNDEERKRRAAGPSSIGWPFENPLAKYEKATPTAPADVQEVVELLLDDGENLRQYEREARIVTHKLRHDAAAAIQSLSLRLQEAERACVRVTLERDIGDESLEELREEVSRLTAEVERLENNQCDCSTGGV